MTISTVFHFSRILCLDGMVYYWHYNGLLAELTKITCDLINPFHSTGTLAKSGDPDEMPHDAAFH